MRTSDSASPLKTGVLTMSGTDKEKIKGRIISSNTKSAEKANNKTSSQSNTRSAERFNVKITPQKVWDRGNFALVSSYAVHSNVLVKSDTKTKI